MLDKANTDTIDFYITKRLYYRKNGVVLGHAIGVATEASALRGKFAGAQPPLPSPALARATIASLSLKRGMASPPVAARKDLGSGGVAKTTNVVALRTVSHLSNKLVCRC